jgi:NADP-dependent 3-hydroxy acid dehydrogenase YdfG
MSAKRALVTGVGPGTGVAIVQRLVKGGYEVAMIARNADRLRKFEEQVPGARAFVADVTDTPQLNAALRSAPSSGLPK